MNNRRREERTIMKTKHTTQLIQLAGLALLGALTPATLGQGTINFNEPWNYVGQIPYQSYREGGMSFLVTAPPPRQPYYSMVRMGSLITSGVPHNGTPYLRFSGSSLQPDTVVFGLGNGNPFGLISVDLADPVAPSQTPLAITFNGYRTDGALVSATFSAGGGNSQSFQTFLFGSGFASGLERVEIPSQFWAMDNLVFVPEPGVWSLLGPGVLALAVWRRKRVG
jgi:hypothetical protein